LRGAAAALILPLAIAGTSAAADAPVAPDCNKLLSIVQNDPSSIHDGAPLLSVSAIVEDEISTDDARICTGVGHYRDSDIPVTYTARWKPIDDTFDIEMHPATNDEAVSRARTLRTLYHPKGADGTFSLADTSAGCLDPDYKALATRELRLGISFLASFYREPDIQILDIATNGFGSGLLANCIATVGNGKEKGDIFIGTNWTGNENDRRTQFYVLDAGPEGFKLKDRLWELDGK
jgi:hypothetical protein